ncbi:MAG: hypothetical protein RSD67_02445 [Oscillospiraceae bacterium]
MTNITYETQVAVQEMVRESFIANSKVDRMKSVLGTTLAYNKTSDLIHLGIAHAFSVHFGDGLGDLLEHYNISIIYGDIPLADKTYATVKDVIFDLFEVCTEYQNKLNMCAKVANDNMDTHIYIGLLDLIDDFDEIMTQVILLKDKIEIYNENVAYDAHISENFWLLGEDD